MRWSPRTVMLVVVVLCGSAQADEAAAVRMVERVRGVITRDEKQPNNPVIKVEFLFKEVSDADLKELRDLCLRNSEIGDSGARALATSPHLNRLMYLSLDGNRITDEGAAEFARSDALPKLEYLNLERNSVQNQRAALFDRFGRNCTGV